MDSWIFIITDVARDSVYVLGTGANVDDAEADARSKWDGIMSARSDYDDRLPISDCRAFLSPPNLIV